MLYTVGERPHRQTEEYELPYCCPHEECQPADVLCRYRHRDVYKRQALDEAIAEAEKIDLSNYTEETADAVSKALAFAKSLSLTATQEEMDAAAKALNDAVYALKVVSENQPGEETNNPGNNTDKPDENVGKPDGSTNVPQTGDNSNMTIWLVLLFVSSGGIATAMTLSQKRRKAK